MKSIQLHQLALCCSTGGCGVDVDQALAGRYPTRADLARWAGIASQPAAAEPPSGCCSNGKCC